MSLETVYKAGEEVYSITLPLAELEEIIDFYPNLERNLNNIFRTKHFGEDYLANNKNELLTNIEQIIEVINSHDFYHYSISYEYLGTAVKGDTNITGKMNNEDYWFESGFNKCNLIKVIVDTNGIGHEGQVIDIRAKENFKDDEIGTINIDKKKKPFKLKSKLVKLKKFLESVNDDDISIMVG